MKKKSIKIGSLSSEEEVSIRKEFFNLYKNSPIPDNELLSNLGLYLSRQNLSRILFINELYQKILDIHGVVIEFGVRWGQNLSLLGLLRGVYEPFNYSRKVVGFDTFNGFPSVDRKDGNHSLVTVGAYATTKNYEEYLKKILTYHEQESPLSHIKKFALIKGDAVAEIDDYFKNNPETIIALAYFDFDLYKPTKKCLEAIRDHLPKGSVVGFDEISDHDFPGEMLAFKEVFGLDKYKLIHSSFSPSSAYIII